ncbi:hypothetical protein BCT06_12650 [Vibrio breoganii]|uniref:AAA family ATPase n=1 Tax=Vibrio breoganii TaxID=553239 RepID=UPI000C859715|nr:helicase RepA family protein [Vibrio breoganii]PMO60340.1 hypothetical protein BCT06_12650 [Vibrio breoganii]
MKETSSETLKQFNFRNLNVSRGSALYDTPQPWLIKKLIPSKSMAVMYGAPATFKSFTTVDMACTISVGSEWNGRKTQQGSVLYIAAEDSHGIKKRIRAWEIDRGQTVNHLWVLGNRVSAVSAEQREELIGLVGEIEQRSSTKVVLIIIDTLARCFVGDENSSKDMGDFTNAWNHVAQQTDCSVLFVHHSGKDASKGSRGSNSLLGAIDTELQLKRSKNSSSVQLINHKQKNEETAEPSILRFEEVSLDIMCEEGKPITSLVCASKSDQHKEHMLTSVERYSHYIHDLLKKSSTGCLTRKELKDSVFAWDDDNQSTIKKRLERALSCLTEKNIVTYSKQGSRASDSDLISIIH